MWFVPSNNRQRLRRQPTQEDLSVWSAINKDLLEWLYTGMTGFFQIAGHRVIDIWARPYNEKVVLEIGSGHGHHLRYGKNNYQCYIGLDIEYKFLSTLKERLPRTRVVNADSVNLPFRNKSVDCVLSVYCFEHLRRLRDCLKEIQRVLKPTGELLVGLPAEGGLVYEIGRRLTSKRYMERKYRIDYDAIVGWEHWNTCHEVIEEIGQHFFIRGFRYLPFFIPSVHLNVIIVLRALPRKLV
jgi:SAM-dependent methyltransferase